VNENPLKSTWKHLLSILAMRGSMFRSILGSYQLCMLSCFL